MTNLTFSYPFEPFQVISKPNLKRLSGPGFSRWHTRAKKSKKGAQNIGEYAKCWIVFLQLLPPSTVFLTIPGIL
jgi:hypothetical protein